MRVIDLNSLSSGSPFSPILPPALLAYPELEPDARKPSANRTPLEVALVYPPKVPVLQVDFFLLVTSELRQRLGDSSMVSFEECGRVSLIPPETVIPHLQGLEPGALDDVCHLLPQELAHLGCHGRSVYQQFRCCDLAEHGFFSRGCMFLKRHPDAPWPASILNGCRGMVEKGILIGYVNGFLVVDENCYVSSALNECGNFYDVKRIE